MSRVQEIEEQLRSLSPAELRELRCWIEELEARQWGEEIARDSDAGKLDFLMERALKDENEGKTASL